MQPAGDVANVLVMLRWQSVCPRPLSPWAPTPWGAGAIAPTHDEEIRASKKTGTDGSDAEKAIFSAASPL